MASVGPLRAVANGFVVAFITLFFCFRAYVARVFDPTGDKVIDLARDWARWITRLGGIDVKVHWLTADGRPLDPHQPYVFMSNHASSIDIWALYVALPVRVRMIAKKQLASVPFLGWAMRAGRFFFVDRQNPHAARRTMEQAAARIRGGDSVLLFPEGTRSRTNTLGPFKKGGFHLAVNAGVPIVPCAVRGAYELQPPGRFAPQPGTVDVLIGDPIPTAGLGDLERAGLPAALIDPVRNAVAALLSKSLESE